MIIIAEKTFKKSFKRLVKKSPQLQVKILEVLELLEQDPFYPSLKSHKLTGQLKGLAKRFMVLLCYLQLSNNFYI